MSMSRGINQAKQAGIVREARMPIINVKNAISKTLKALSGRALEVILVFSFISTAIGELFGRAYGLKWYILLAVILVAYVIKETIALKPEDELKIVEPKKE